MHNLFYVNVISPKIVISTKKCSKEIIIMNKMEFY